MITLSEETLKGGELINNKRVSAGLQPLDMLPVPLLEENKSIIDRCDEEEHKISSSNYRMRLLGTLLKPPHVNYNNFDVPDSLYKVLFFHCLKFLLFQTNTNIPKCPYIIGLTGGIASGKSSIANYLKELGAFVINADTLGHGLYDINQPGYEAVLKAFGSSILTSDHKVDRKKLGAIVFTNKVIIITVLFWITSNFLFIHVPCVICYCYRIS